MNERLIREDTLTDQVSEAARLAARLVLENGGETYRAEDTARHIALAFGFEADIIAFPTGLTMTISGADGSRTTIARVTASTVDLMKLEQVNSVSRALCDGSMPIGEALSQLEHIRDQRPLSMGKSVLFAGCSTAMFAIMFGANWFEMLSAGGCGALVQLALSKTPDQAGMPVSSLLSGFLTSLLALLITRLFGMGDANLIIISTMMPFLPGLALTNAMRDSMRGDLLSGGARLGQALTRAVVLAGGAGAALWLYMALGGIVK